MYRKIRIGSRHLMINKIAISCPRTMYYFIVGALQTPRNKLLIRINSKNLVNIYLHRQVHSSVCIYVQKYPFKPKMNVANVSLLKKKKSTTQKMVFAANDHTVYAINESLEYCVY